MVKNKNKFVTKVNNRCSIKNNEKGAISILTVMAIAAFMGFLFFIIFDYSTYQQKKQQLQHFSDNAAAAVATKATTLVMDVGFEEVDCAIAGLEPGSNGKCEIPLQETKIIFDPMTKLIQKENGIAHEIARKEFKLTNDMLPTNQDTNFKSFRMEVEIYDGIGELTEIETEIGTYKVSKPTVVVKVWATVRGPFLGKDLETITVGIFETKEQF